MMNAESRPAVMEGCWASQEDIGDSYLKLPETELHGMNHANGKLASPSMLSHISVSMPNIAISPNLHHSSRLLSDEETYNTSSRLTRMKLFVYHKLTFMRDVTSLDGLRFMRVTRSTKIRIPLWLMLFFTSVAVMIWALYTVSILYFDTNTFFSRTKHFPTRLNFPAVTICNHNPYYDINVYDNEFDSFPNETQVAIFYEFFRKDRIFEVNTSRLLEIINDTFSFNIFTEEFNPSVNVETILREHGHKLQEDNLVSCNFDGTPCSVDDFVEVVTAFGLCYTFNLNSSRSVSSAGTSHGLSLVIDIEQHRYMYYTSHTAGLQVFVHPQDEYPYSGEYHGFSVSPGFETQVAISLTNTKLMEPPYGQCGDRSIHDPYIFPCNAAWSSNNVTNSLNSTAECPQQIKHYTRQRCLDECEALYQNRECGCKADYLPGADIRVCNLNELFNCLLEATDQFAVMKNTFCNCPVECNRVRYSTRLSSSYFPAKYYRPLVEGVPHNVSRENYSSLLLYFDQLEYIKVTEEPEYSTSRYIADLGNHIQLFTGAGVMTFFELFELCFHN